MTKKNGKKLKGTPAAQWRKPQVSEVVVALPSGNEVVIRRPSLLDLVLEGAIPDSLGGVVEQILAGADLGMGGEQSISPMPMLGKITGMNEMAGAICRAVFVDPLIAPEGAEPGESEIYLSDLSFADRLAVFTALTEGAEPLASFPEATGEGPAA